QAQTQTTDEGRFAFTAVPAAEYTITATKPGFQTLEQGIIVRSGTVTPLALTLSVGAVAETVHVTGTEGTINLKSVTTESLVTRDQIEQTPGALRTNSMDAITQFVPGSYMVHDQLHIRGGHQVSWLVDGVPVPNTNIADTVGPQFDPKDIETIEIKRGGYSAENGDRTYGVFNVVPRSGFERDREAELLITLGNFHEANGSFSLGDHNDRTAYYASATVNRSRLGLETPVAETLHDRTTALGGFGSLMYKAPTGSQRRLVVSVRSDHFQIPNGPDDQAAGIDDTQRERDAFGNFSWLKILGSRAFLTVSPFYHYNRGAFDGGPNDPIVATDHRTSQYLGAQVVLAASRGPHNAQVGAYGFHQGDDVRFGLRPAGAAGFDQAQTPTGHVEVAFAQDHYTPTDRLTLNAGVRVTRFSGALAETAVSPRVGAVMRLPGCECAVRGSYGRYYQPPPLTTVSGPLLDLAADQGFGFLPLKGERDEQYELGVAVSARGWAVDADYFRTNARNFFDHTAIGSSNIFIPLTIDRARIRGWEATIRSPRGRRAQVHVTYAHQFVEGRGAISGGLTSFEPPREGFFFLDHDQRDTLAAGLDVNLGAGVSASASIAYGSGFLEGDGPAHKPAHTTGNLQGSKTFGKRWTLLVTALNVADTRFLLDESNTFGGTHFNMPRQVSAGVRYRFHY
ncbi:MAG TPA: TonB-dependent receptor, partial [Vicinamibacterales bacterium]